MQRLENGFSPETFQAALRAPGRACDRMAILRGDSLSLSSQITGLTVRAVIPGAIGWSVP